MPIQKPPTPERVNLILDELRKGHTPRASCGAAGISVRTMERWCVADENLAEEISVASGFGQHRLESEAFSTRFPSVAKVLTHRLACMDREGWALNNTVTLGGALTLSQALAQSDSPGTGTTLDVTGPSVVAIDATIESII